MPNPPEILHHEYGIQLRRMPDGSLRLSVLCGRIGEYEVEFELNDAERETCERDGADAIRNLAHRVMADPRSYQDR